MLFDLPDRERAQRWRTGRLAGAQIETGVMPGAADAVPDDQPLRQRSVVMAAMRVDREDLALRTHQQDTLVADMPQQGLGGEVVGGHTFCKIRPRRGRLFVSHVLLREQNDCGRPLPRRTPVA